MSKSIRHENKLSTRAKNILSVLGYETIEEVLNNYDEIRDIELRGFGKNTKHEILLFIERKKICNAPAKNDIQKN